MNSSEHCLLTLGGKTGIWVTGGGLGALVTGTDGDSVVGGGRGAAVVGSMGATASWPEHSVLPALAQPQFCFSSRKTVPGGQFLVI
jgi:hypothetical protein